jgi:NitT/TauT family transport system ATP-binding protein
MTSTAALTPSGARVRLDHMRVDYADGRAAEVDLDVAPGEVVVLLGPSGCGKSTILRALAGLLPVAAGTAEVDGIPIGGPGPQCAMVFQEDALLPWRSARRNVEFALAMRGVRRGDRKAAAVELLRQVGLDGFADHLPGRLSGGMRQRVQLARTLAVEPRVMLMDEPFGALDAQTRADMQRLLVSVWEQHRMTVLFVTHDVDEALLIADRIVLLTPRPASIIRTVEIDHPRSPGARFEPEFARRRYEILAVLSEDGERATADA